MTTLNYVSQTAQSVSVSYVDMPAGAVLVFRNETSGTDTPAQGDALAAGNGSAEIAIPEVPAGRYRLRALQDRKYLAETVPFYIN
jgi:hypothetical protein